VGVWDKFPPSGELRRQSAANGSDLRNNY